MAEQIVKGTALYLRNIDKDHGSPRDFAQRCKAMGLSWIAIAGIWQELRDGRVRSGFMNSAAECRAFADACALVGITPYIWGYPWQGAEREFTEGMMRCAGDHKLILIDPELGMNPTRSTAKGPKSAAERSALDIVHGLRTAGARRVGLSSYGIVPPWFPLVAFMRAGLDFAGGQTYTDDANVDRSIASYLEHMRWAGVDIQLVPNFGTYSWDTSGGARRARPKTPDELRSHLLEFIDEAEPVDAMIGWAENFVTKRLEPELAKFSRLLARGACALPQVA